MDMTNKHKKRCSTSLDPRMGKRKKSTITSVGEDMEEMGETEMVQLL